MSYPHLLSTHLLPPEGGQNRVIHGLIHIIHTFPPKKAAIWTVRRPNSRFVQNDKSNEFPAFSRKIVDKKELNQLEQLSEYSLKNKASITFPMGFGVPDHLSPA